MRRLNIKFLAGLVILISLVGGGAFVLHRVQVRRTAQALLKHVAEAEKAGKFEEAKDELQRYLALKPQDTEARAHYAMLLAQVAMSPTAQEQAILALEDVLRRDPKRPELRRRLVSLEMDAGRFADAQKHLDILIKTTPVDGALENLLGGCYEGNGAFDKAVAAYEKACKSAPQPQDAFERLALLLRQRLNDPARADKTMDALVAAHRDSYAAFLSRARYRRRYQLPDAETDLEQARKLAPDAVDVLLDVARVTWEKKGLEGARPIVVHGLERHPSDPRLIEALADLELRSGHTAEAVVTLKQGLEKNPTNNDLRWALVHLLVQRGDTTGITEHIDRLRAAGSPSPPLEYLAATLQFNKGQWNDARSRLEHLQPALKPWPELKTRAYVVLARCFGAVGEFDQQHAAFRAAVNLDPLWVPARLGLASSLAALGKVDQAIEEYQRLKSQIAEVRLPLAQLLVLRNLQLPEAQRRWDDVDALLAQTAPDDLEPMVLRAEILVDKGDFDGAQALLKKAAKQHPKQPEPWLAQVALARRRDRLDEAFALLDQARKTVGDGVALRLETARCATSRNDARTVALLKEQMRDLDTFSVAEQQQLFQGLIGHFERVGAHQEAEDTCRQWAERAPRDLNPRIFLFNLARQRGDDSTMTRLVGEVKQIEGDDGTYWRYCEARRLSRSSDRSDQAARNSAREFLTELSAQRPGWAPIPLALAELDEQSGARELAIKNYQRAIDLGERSVPIVQRTAQLLFASRRYDEADRVLKLLPQSEPLSGNLQRLATGIALQTQNPQRALDLAHQAVTDHPKDFREYVWLGQVLTVTGQLAEAETTLRKAVKLAPKEPDAWIALIRHLVSRNRKQQAETALREAEKALPEDQAALALAQCLEGLGHAEQAFAYYAKALAAKPTDSAVQRAFIMALIRAGRFPDAESHLQTFSAQKNKSADDAAWVRRTLALVLVQIDYKHAQEALSLLGPADETPDDFRLRTRVLAAQRTKQARAEAIQTLEELGKRESLEADDRFLLAQLLELSGQWPKARDQWQSALAMQPKNPLYLAEFATALRRHGQTDDASVLVAQLEKIEPNAPRMIVLKVRLLKADGRSDQAVAALNAYVERTKIASEPIAALWEELGRFEEAEAVWRQVLSAPGRAERTLAFAEYLGRRNKPDQALEQTERAWATCAADAVARTCVAILDATQLREAQLQRAAAQIESAGAKHPDDSGLVITLAIVRERQGRFGDAERLYRRALERDKGNVIALNNLAWLIALQEGQGGNALALVNRAIEQVGPNAELLDTRGIIALTMGQTNRALADFHEAIATRPSAPLYFHEAQAQLSSGHPAEAVRAFAEMKKRLDRAQQWQIDQEERTRVAAGKPAWLPGLEELAQGKGIKVGKN